MAKPTSDLNSTDRPPVTGSDAATNSTSTTATPNEQPGVVRCWTGAAIAAAIAYACYQMTVAIATTFAAKPVLSNNVATLNIAVAVRTLVVGICALGTGVFGLAALGLFALGIQLIVQRLTGKTTTPSSN